MVLGKQAEGIELQAIEALMYEWMNLRVPGVEEDAEGVSGPGAPGAPGAVVAVQIAAACISPAVPSQRRPVESTRDQV